MKKTSELINAVKNRDSQALAKIYAPADARNVAPSKEAIDFFNGIFQQLKVIFPAMQAHIKDQASLDELRIQWIAAFREAGITKQSMVDAGLRRARQSETPYLPSPGQFISWCNDESASMLGLPDIETIMKEFRRYCSERGLYDTPEAFPWSGNAMYWIVTDMRLAMIERNLTTIEIEKFAVRKVREWAKRIQAGESIPEPVIRIADMTRPASTVDSLGIATEKTNKTGAEMLARIRSKTGK